MARIYRLKNVPQEVREYFVRHFDGMDYNFYWYWKSTEHTTENKIYGCEVINNGEYYHNATQANINWFIKEIK